MSRPGITLLEILVLVVLAVILLGLGVHFLVGQRERAQRLTCAYHLKRIGESIYYYEGQNPTHRQGQAIPEGPRHSFLPAARIAEQHATWAVLLAPYLERENPLKDWDLARRYYDQPEHVRVKDMEVFFCPSRPRESRTSRAGDVPNPKAPHVPGAVGDFACVAGDGNPDRLWTGPQANGPLILAQVRKEKDGLILDWESRTSLKSLPRGLSNILFVGEKHVPMGDLGNAEVGDGSLYNGHYPANFARVGGPKFGLASGPADSFNNNFGSYHPGICQFLLGDCSVRSFAVTLSPEVLGFMAVRE